MCSKPGIVIPSKSNTSWLGLAVDLPVNMHESTALCNASRDVGLKTATFGITIQAKVTKNLLNMHSCRSLQCLEKKKKYFLL